MSKKKDLTGMKFTRLSPIKIIGQNKYGYYEWL